jgi:hypothetical protein
MKRGLRALRQTTCDRRITTVVGVPEAIKEA